MTNTVSLAKAPIATVSLKKAGTVFASPTDAMLGYFEAQTALHNLLGSAASKAADITLTEVRMQIAAGDYELLSGRKLLEQANMAIQAAFVSQDINKGNWRRKGLRLHTVNSDGTKISPSVAYMCSSLLDRPPLTEKAARFLKRRLAAYGAIAA